MFLAGEIIGCLTAIVLMSLYVSKSLVAKTLAASEDDRCDALFKLQSKTSHWNARCDFNKAHKGPHKHTTPEGVPGRGSGEVFYWESDK